MLRLIWGEDLENEIKGPIADEFWAFKDPLLANIYQLIHESSVPSVLFYFREGRGWIAFQYNTKGWELYGASIMSEK